jgi:tetratricopeptide (TPR) repeat protein
MIVVLAAVAAAALVVGVTLATRQTPTQPHARKGKPPADAIGLVPSQATPQIRRAFADWPHGTLATMRRLAGANPRDPSVQFNYGLVLLWSGYDADAASVLRVAKRVGRDTPYEISADSLLHPQYFPGYPPFQPIERNPLLLRGARLQAQGRQHSAERLFELAARRAPDDDEAQVAAAVGRFDKGNLAASFSRLGPLSRRFPRSQSVRFHLGLLLAWTGQRDAALAEFRKAAALGPKTALGQEAKTFVRRLVNGGTNARKR